MNEGPELLQIYPLALSPKTKAQFFYLVPNHSSVSITLFSRVTVSWESNLGVDM